MVHPQERAGRHGLLGVPGLLFAALTCFASTTYAQPTAAQLDRLDEAADLARQERLPEALELYDQLVTEMDLNILHLSRGRVLFKLGRCWDALDAFDSVLAAPPDPDFEISVVEERLDRYREELEQTCPGRVQIRCPRELTAFTVDGEKLQQGCGETAELPAGEHLLVGLFHEQEVETEISVRGGRSTDVAMNVNRDTLLTAGRLLLNQGRPATGFLILEDALRIKEDQDVYLLLTEALIEEGKCQSAFATMEGIEGSAASERMSALERVSRQEDLRDLFTDRCGEQVSIQCTPAAMNIRIDRGAPQACSSAPIFLAVGAHNIRGTASVSGKTRTRSKSFRVKAREVTVVELEVGEAELLRGWGIAGVSTATVGLLVLGSALALDLALIAPEVEDYEAANARFRDEEELEIQYDRINRLQTINISLATVGGLMLLGGGVMLTYDLWDREDVSEEVSSLRFGVSVDSTFVSVRLGRSW